MTSSNPGVLRVRENGKSCDINKRTSGIQGHDMSYDVLVEATHKIGGLELCWLHEWSTIETRVVEKYSYRDRRARVQLVTIKLSGPCSKIGSALEN